MSPWAETEGGRMRLVVLPPAPDGTIRAGLQIEPKPGWITYWREPGNSGIPPQVTVNPLSGVMLDAIAYPVPKHVVNGTIDDIAYDAPVTFPLSLSARNGRPAGIDATAFVGICREVCIPFQANLSVKLGPPQSRPEEQAILDAADARLPEPPSEDFAVAAHAMSADMTQLSLVVTLPEEGTAAPEIIVTGPSGHVFTKQLNAARTGRTVKTDIAIGRLPKNYEIKGKIWSVLVVDGDRAIESPLAFD